MITTITPAGVRSAELRTVFVDNLTLASVQRLLFDHYEQHVDVMLSVDEPARAKVIFHDLANLAGFVETIVTHDQIVTNPEFTYIWDSAADGGLAARIAPSPGRSNCPRRNARRSASSSPSPGTTTTATADRRSPRCC